MGGSVAFWLLSGEFVLEITYQAAESCSWDYYVTCPLGQPGLAEKASPVASPSKARSPLPANQPSQLWPATSNQQASVPAGPHAATCPGGTETVCTSPVHRRCFLDIYLLQSVAPWGGTAWGAREAKAGPQEWRVPLPTGMRAPRGQTPPVSTTNFSNVPLHQQSDREWAASPSSVSVTSPVRGDRSSNLITKGGCEH